MKLVLTLVVLVGFVFVGLSKPAYTPVFAKSYKLKKGGKLEKAKCAVCHVGVSVKLNPYGIDLKKAMSGAKQITPALLKKIESKDSDGDKLKNIAEIKKDTLPGDKKSK